MIFKEKIIMEITLNKLLGDNWEIVKQKMQKSLIKMEI